MQHVQIQKGHLAVHVIAAIQEMVLPVMTMTNVLSVLITVRRMQHVQIQKGHLAVHVIAAIQEMVLPVMTMTNVFSVLIIVRRMQHVQIQKGHLAVHVIAAIQEMVLPVMTMKNVPLGTEKRAQESTCTNTEGAFSCTCNSGYSGDGVTCDDKTNFVLGTDNCSQDATCTNTEGAFSCTCNSGYSGDGVTCDDDDECSLGTDNCAEVATCTNTQGAFSCTCNSGYSGDGVTCDVDSSNDTMMLVIILSSVVVGLTLVIILLFICFCQYRRKIKGAAETNDKPVKENRFRNHNVIATNIRSTVREEEYDTIVDESDTIDVNALRETKNKDDGYLDIDLVNRNDLMQTYEKGVVRDQINECLDFNAVGQDEQDLQDEYDYPYKGHKVSEGGYVNVNGVRRTLPEIPKNSSTTGKEGTSDPYSELKHKKLPEHVYERIADKEGYLKPLGLGNMKPVGP
ncbi:uncharacterized protein LOC123561004 [Mercenaria mercenaria]|uniref:uncharacterized protein LOC123561004 n=1 Tax=Mercenaria mercenaria TaxID=6596 RepID=UPI00234F83C3|nr:uncharacterized protein LOC123561004 [Mercenaria mercenaria]